MSRRTGPPPWIEARLARSLGSGLWGQATLGDLAEAYHRMRARRPALACDLWYAWQAVSLLAHRGIGRDGAPSAGRGGALAADVRWAVRVTLRRPLLTVAVVTTLALGLGANAAVFSVIDGTFRATDWWADDAATLALAPGHEFSRGQLWVFRENPQAYGTLGLYRLEALSVAVAGGEPSSVAGASISPGLFASLRVQPTLGRGFLPEEAEPGGEAPVVISRGFWRREMGGDPGVVGSRLDVNGVPRTVVGVQGAGGTAPGSGTDVWLPVVLNPRDPDLFPDISYTLVGVLREGTTPRDGQATLRAFGRELSGRFPFFYRPDYLQDATVEAARARQRELLRTPLFLLMGGTVTLLLIAALNVGNMLVARAAERRRELAVRRALGAERGRVVRQLATESALLALLGAALGLAVAGPAAGLLEGLFPADVAVARSPWTSPPVALFVGVAALLAWLVLAGVPVAAFLAGERRSVTARMERAGSAPRALVVVQSALATVLLVAAVLLVRSVDNLRSVPLGFDADGVTAVYVAPPESYLRDRARLRGFQEDVVRRAAALPGVTSAGMTSVLPLDQAPPATPVNPRSAPVEVNVALLADRFAVDEGFFDAMGVRLEAGRLPAGPERGRSPSAVVVNRALADALWPGEDPVGRSVAIDPHGWDDFLPVVGVVSNFRSDGLVGPERPAVFVSLWERAERRTALLVRTSGVAPGIAATLRRTVRRADPGVAVGAVRPLTGVVRDAYGAAWVTMGLLAAMATLATALAALGIHAVLAHHVARRRRDVGVRLALGAGRGSVVGGVLGSGLRYALAGVVLGCAVAAASTGLLRSLLFGVDALAPGAFVLPALAVLAAAALAALGPALRAGRTAPAEVLREE